MWGPSNHCWIVYCKNRWFHLLRDFRLRHKIPLGITDNFAPCPDLEDRFAVTCNVCGREYLYRRGEVRRSFENLPEAFTPHPRFW